MGKAVSVNRTGKQKALLSRAFLVAGAGFEPARKTAYLTKSDRSAPAAHGVLTRVDASEKFFICH
jgi:hypothetical protein